MIFRLQYIIIVATGCKAFTNLKAAPCGVDNLARAK